MKEKCFTTNTLAYFAIALTKDTTNILAYYTVAAMKENVLQQKL